MLNNQIDFTGDGEYFFLDGENILKLKNSYQVFDTI